MMEKPLDHETERTKRLVAAQTRLEELDRQIARLMRLRAKWARRLGARERSLKLAALRPRPEEFKP
jgi:hypothetical protein